ncbi:MAG: sodium/solute symporter [Phycisphaeraceae bacterium]|nr:sodium/solute symporter [Phycisphaeraceae bacterium]
MNLHVADYLVLIAYLAVIACIGLYVSRRGRSSEGYFLAGRRLPTWVVAFTLMATLIGSGTFVGHPATVYQKGMILLLGHLTLPVVLLIVSIFIIPFYRHVVKMSVYEYLGQRFGLGGRMYASIGFLADRIFDLGVTLLTTAIPLKLMTGWELHWIILSLGAFTAAYTMIGGIEAVVWTDVAQGVLLIFGAILILLRLIFATEVGPPGAVISEAWQQGRFTLGSFDLSWNSLFDTQNTTQWIFLLAFTVGWSRRYVCDQHMVQRYLIAGSDQQARRGVMVNAAMCVPIYLTFMFIGACLFGYYTLSSESGPRLADDVMPYFIVHHLPAGVIGLILAAVLAASMSSISADLNSLATVLTTDYFVNFLPSSSDKARVLFGRLMVIACGTAAAMIGLAMIPTEGASSIMERGVTIAAIISGGVLGLFNLGFLTTRATRRGCYIGIAACLLFTSWGVCTEPTHRIFDMGFNFEFNPILIGLFGHLVLFVVGYLASVMFGGHRPENVEQLTLYRLSRQ